MRSFARIFWPFRRTSSKSPDSYTVKARSDQKIAVYPGCQEGTLDCGSQTCSCDGHTPSDLFVAKRAALLRKRDFERREGIAPKRVLRPDRRELRARGQAIGDVLSNAANGGIIYTFRQMQDLVKKRWPGMTDDEAEFVLDYARGLDPDWDLSDSDASL